MSESVLEIPPDATAFKVGGKDYFLYFGPLEMVRLQREWGLVRLHSESVEVWTAKNITFQQRCNGGVMDDQVSMLRIALGRCIKEYAKSETPLTLPDNDAVAEFLSGLESKELPFMRVNALFLQLMADCFGFKDAEKKDDPVDPKVPTSETEGSTPSTS